MSKHAHTLARAHKHQARQQPAYVIMFVRQHIADVKIISARTGVPVEVILAQSALESNWGRTLKDNAYFGIKGKSPTGKSTSFSTHEVTLSGQRVSEIDQFRAYSFAYHTTTSKVAIRPVHETISLHRVPAVSDSGIGILRPSKDRR